MSGDLVTELRLIGCHQNGEARCTCNVGQEAADRIKAQASRIAALEAERDAARAAVNRLGRAMGVVPGAAQCFGDVIDEAIKRLSAFAETERE